jgi:hypothetical protein
MRTRNALVIGGALAGLGYSLVRHYNAPAYTPESSIPPQVEEPVRETPPTRPETTEIPRARTARAPRTTAPRARPKKAKVAVEPRL